MSVITIRTTDEEKDTIQIYAEFMGMSMSDFVKTAVIEKIEDIFDLESIEEYERKISGKNSVKYTHESIMDEFFFS